MATATAGTAAEELNALLKRKEGLEEELSAAREDLDVTREDAASRQPTGQGAKTQWAKAEELERKIKHVTLALKAIERPIEAARERLKTERQEEAQDKVARLEPEGREAFRELLRATHRAQEALTAFDGLADGSPRQGAGRCQGWV